MKTRYLGRFVMLVSILGIGATNQHLRAQQPGPNFAPSAEPHATSSDVWRNDRYAELYKLEQRTQALAAELRAKPDATKEAELKKLVEESFDKRHAFQVADAKTLADKLAKLQDTMRKREDKKSDIIARRVKQLLGEADDLDWNLTPPRDMRTSSNFGQSAQYPPLPTPQSQPLPSPVPVQGPNTLSRGPGVTEASQGDVQILQIELERAKLNLKESETALKQGLALEEGRAISAEDLSKRRFAVETRRLDLDLAQRRLQIVMDREKKQANPTTQPK